MDKLGKLFGGESRIKLMRLFLLNPNKGFESSDIESKSKVKNPVLRKELNLLGSIGFIKKKVYSKETEKKKGSKKVTTKKKITGWFFDKSFEHADSLKALILGSTVLNREKISDKLKSAGKIKLILVAGVFIDRDDSRVDIMIVGDRLNRPTIDTAFRAIESEIGKDLVYSIMETEEFNYRMKMYDKFVSDVLDYPYELVMDKIGVGECYDRSKN